MDLMALMDLRGAAIVLGGTLLATVLGSGRRELMAATGAMWQMLHRPFNYEHARSEIARDVETIRHDGVLRSPKSRSSDREIAQATDALIHDRSVKSLIDAHEQCQHRRREQRELSLRPLFLAGEMAPVFGMAGTLFSLSQLNAGDVQDLAMMATVGMAIITTLYGLLLAHLVFLPMGRMISRRGLREEEDRKLLIEWLARQLASSLPHPGGRRAHLEQVA